MARATVELPSMLAPIAGNARRVAVEGDTLAEALADAFARHPALRVHVFDETGALRQHVLCFLNETNSRWLAGMDEPIRDGDVITILQAVSGG